MLCIVTAGPTYEPLDSVRRLTNFSTGRLGSELAAFLASRGHEVRLLLSELAQAKTNFPANRRTELFTTTSDLAERIHALSSSPVDAVFHAAAVSDFRFGKIWAGALEGQPTEIKSGKISTREGALLAELVPTTKIIAQLRGWFPKARLVGWKYEVDGDRAAVIRLGQEQISECKTDACVANGPAYGAGFGLVQADSACEHAPDEAALFQALEHFIRKTKT
ncbi:MAG: DNA/pantothenate metabolism flavoprotein domain protein [Verrucomicrobia bacterium]|nr:MAG: DNA/pantothenate metabolism flavoprotein domain protein [Verrucomicrobiota bacterium]